MAVSRQTAWRVCWELSGRPPSPGHWAAALRRAATASRATAGAVNRGPAGLLNPVLERPDGSPQPPALCVPAGPRSPRHPRHGGSPQTTASPTRRVPAVPGPPVPGMSQPVTAALGPVRPGGSLQAPGIPRSVGPCSPRPSASRRVPAAPAPLTMARACGSRQRELPLGSGSGGITLRERTGEGGCGSMRRASAGHPI